MNRVLLIGIVLLCAGCAGLKLPRLGGASSDATPEAFPSSRGEPYPVTAAYFGHLAGGEEGSARVLYLWLPREAEELGVRVVSPATGWAQPTESAIVGPGFEPNAAQAGGFDAQLRLERCLDAINPEDLRERCEGWTTLGENDDSTELPEAPAPEGGESAGQTNALVRARSVPSEAARAIIRGLYRVTVSVAKEGQGSGTFWVQVGASRRMPKIQIAESRTALAERVR